ncbi:Protein ASC1 [Entamoeba marina]
MKSSIPTPTLWDKSFILQLLTLLPIVLICIPASFTRGQQFSGENIPYPSDLLPSLISLSVISFLRYFLVNKIFPPISEKLVTRKADWSDSFYSFRLQRFGLTLFKLTYFVITAPLGVFLFRNEDWMPSALFGKGKSDLSLLWENFPFVPKVNFLLFYYCYQLGYHSHSLLFHICSKPRNDYFENLLHHIVTVMLIVFSYVNNCGRIGILVMILHDIVDVTVYATKATTDLKNQIPTHFLFVFLLITYFRFRLWVLPRYVIPSAIDAINYIPPDVTGGLVVYYLLVGMLCSLFILHIYWYGLILDMILKAFKKEGIVDPQATQISSEK